MSIVNELTLVSILTALAEKYPHGVKGEEIVLLVGLDRRDDVKRCLGYSIEKGYVLAVAYGRHFPEMEFEVESYRLTAEGIDYLNNYNKKLAEVLKEIKRKPIGFSS